jgi:hypothetical protein
MIIGIFRNNFSLKQQLKLFHQVEIQVFYPSKKDICGMNDLFEVLEMFYN